MPSNDALPGLSLPAGTTLRVARRYRRRGAVCLSFRLPSWNLFLVEKTLADGGGRYLQLRELVLDPESDRPAGRFIVKLVSRDSIALLDDVSRLTSAPDAGDPEALLGPLHEFDSPAYLAELLAESGIVRAATRRAISRHERRLGVVHVDGRRVVEFFDDVILLEEGDGVEMAAIRGREIVPLDDAAFVKAAKSWMERRERTWDEGALFRILGPLPTLPARPEIPDHLRAMAGAARLVERIDPHRAPIVSAGRVLAFGGSDAGPGYNDLLFCLDAATGQSLWDFGGRGQSWDLLSNVAILGSQVIVGRINGLLYSLDLATGRELWTSRHGAPMCAPAAWGGDLYIATADGSLRILTDRGELRDGRKLSPGFAMPIPDGEELWLVGEDAVQLIARPLRPFWSRPLWDRPAMSIPAGGGLAVVLPDALLFLDRRHGRAAWHAVGAWRHLCFDGTTLWAATAEKLAGFDPATGRVIVEKARRGIASLACDGRIVADGVDVTLPGDPRAPISAFEGVVYVTRGVEPSILLHAVRGGTVAWTATIGSFGLT